MMRRLVVTASLLLAAPLGAQDSTAKLAGYALVANQQSADATVIDLAAGTTTTIPVGVGPHEALVLPGARLGVVTIYGTQVPGNGLAVVDLARGTVVRTIDLGEYARPHGIVMLPGAADRVVVTSEASRNVLVVDVAAGQVVSATPTQAQGSHMVALGAKGTRAWTANVHAGSVSEVDVGTGTFVRQVAVAPVTEGIAVTPDGREVWVGSNQLGTVSVVDVATGTVAATIGGFRVPYRLAISPDGRLAAAADPAANQLHLMDVATRKTLASVDLAGSPRGVTITPDGRHALVTLGQSSELAVVELATRKVVRRIPVGASPDGVGFGVR